MQTLRRSPPNLPSPLASSRTASWTPTARCPSSTVFDPSLAALAGTHRIQRVPASEKSGRRHSSIVTVVWLDDIGGAEPVNLDVADVREEFIRTSGKGGQNRNKVSSCVRLTHIPTGIIVVADNQRHQAQNRTVAWERLSAILATQQAEAQHSSTNAIRVSQMDAQRDWTWTSWRDEVKGPGVRSSMKRALAGRLGGLLRASVR